MTLLRLVPLLLVAMAAPAAGQNNDEHNTFDFSLPGARSRGMAGAFVATADDATAVYSNPAGLSLLFRPEISLEGRQWNFTSRAPEAGHAFGRPTGRGLDILEGLRERDWRSRNAGISFLSFVYPGERWAVGVFRHQLARVEIDQRPLGAFFDCSGGFRGENPTPPYCEPHAQEDGVDREFPKHQTYDLSIYSIGSAVAFDWTSRLSIGLAIQYFDFEMASLNEVFSARGDKKYTPADFDPGNLEVMARHNGNDHAWAANVGMLMNLSERWAVGASFRQGPEFEFQVETVTGPANLAGGGIVVNTESANPFRVPDTYAAGLLFRPSPAWRVAMEYDLVQSSQIVEDARNIAVPEDDPEGDLVVDRIRLDDAHQLRGGVEYARIFRNGSVLALRGGAWYAPPFQAHFEADPATGLPAPRWALLFPKRDGTVHWAGGIGVVLGPHLQLDAAADVSEFVDTFALSGIWRF